MTAKPRIAIVIGSTRPGRYADKAAGWILKQAQARDDIERARVASDLPGVSRAIWTAPREADPRKMEKML
jgi:NAD(P)H-dependent FMN reductase